MSGFINSMAVIMMLKICKVFPDMYIMIAFIGMLFAGARAISQAFFRKRSSVSIGFTGDPPDCLLLDFCGGEVSTCCHAKADKTAIRLTLEAAAEENPGGSGMAVERG